MLHSQLVSLNLQGMITYFNAFVFYSIKSEIRFSILSVSSILSQRGEKKLDIKMALILFPNLLKDTVGCRSKYLQKCIL